MCHNASIMRFNTQPPEGGWLSVMGFEIGLEKFQHTAARRRLGVCIDGVAAEMCVSTHSRPKAAGSVWI